ncbi:hypothetical protein PLANTIT3_20111 [Plantibacter sp. T3]|nr:hypothetical protein PLANTIT3_20111 [Plantibacter sp. T3]
MLCCRGVIQPLGEILTRSDSVVCVQCHCSALRSVVVKDFYDSDGHRISGSTFSIGPDYESLVST